MGEYSDIKTNDRYEWIEWTCRWTAVVFETYTMFFLNLISFIIKIPKIVESRECPSVRTAVSAHVPVFEHSETQYPHNGCVIFRAPRIFINITFMSFYLQEVFIN